MTAEASIPVLRFQVGELGLGLVAAAVERLGESAADCPHLGRLLQVPPAAAPIEQRMIELSAYGRRARFVVDGPVALRRIGAHDLLPAAPSLRRHRVKALLGFVRDDSRLMLLLDVAWLVRKAG